MQEVWIGREGCWRAIRKNSASLVSAQIEIGYKSHSIYKWLCAMEEVFRSGPSICRCPAHLFALSSQALEITFAPVVSRQFVSAMLLWFPGPIGQSGPFVPPACWQHRNAEENNGRQTVRLDCTSQ